MKVEREKGMQNAGVRDLCCQMTLPSTCFKVGRDSPESMANTQGWKNGSYDIPNSCIDSLKYTNTTKVTNHLTTQVSVT